MALDLKYEKFKPVTDFVQEHFKGDMTMDFYGKNSVTYCVEATQTLEDKDLEEFFSICDNIEEGLEHDVSTRPPFRLIPVESKKDKKKKKKRKEIKLPPHLEETYEQLKSMEEYWASVKQVQTLWAFNKDYSIEIQINVI